jgi:hypothetical protein
VAGFQTFSSIPFTIPWNFFETLLMVVCSPAPPWITPDTKRSIVSHESTSFPPVGTNCSNISSRKVTPAAFLKHNQEC